jgi:hypothetical protein
MPSDPNVTTPTPTPTGPVTSRAAVIHFKNKQPFIITLDITGSPTATFDAAEYTEDGVTFVEWPLLDSRPSTFLTSNLLRLILTAEPIPAAKALPDVPDRHLTSGTGTLTITLNPPHSSPAPFPVTVDPLGPCDFCT